MTMYRAYKEGLPHSLPPIGWCNISILIPSYLRICSGGSDSVGGCWRFQGGTIAYMAPEMLSAARSVSLKDAAPSSAACGPPIDCWALGLTALELLTGCNLFSIGHCRPPGTLPADWTARQMQYTADLHKDWVCACLKTVMGFPPFLK
jgi:hypothetical protein